MDLTSALGSLYAEVTPIEFYRDIFPCGSLEDKGVYENGKYNGIAVMIGKGKKKTRRLTITDELDGIYTMLQSNEFCIMSPISYAGKSRKAENARFLHAIAIDLDGVETKKHWDLFLALMEQGGTNLLRGLPIPTYIVSSGTGMHLYYVFKEPIPLFRSIVKELEVLKRRLTFQAWGQGASALYENIQYESLFQGFRVVGTITKVGTYARAYEVGDKIDLDYLNSCVPEEYRVKSLVYQSNLSLAEAKEKYPEWYQRRVVENQPKGTWTCKRDLYDWWLRRSGEPLQGHRYWYVMTLATYATKCNISRDELEKDAYSLIPILTLKGDAFTEDDVMHALEAFNDSYLTYPIHTIVERTDMPIEKNKRNGRKQAEHIKIMNAIREIEHPDGSWRNKDGRPDKKKIVKEWREAHPDGKKADCNRETGIDPKTIRKWWDA